MYPTEILIKYTTESNTYTSYLDLLLSIGRNIAFPFTTSVTITISISQAFCSLAAISDLRSSMRTMRLPSKLFRQWYVKLRSRYVAVLVSPQNFLWPRKKHRMLCRCVQVYSYLAKNEGGGGGTEGHVPRGRAPPGGGGLLPEGRV